MIILHVNTSDIEGGAARAAYRLHKSLLESGVDSQMLVQSKKSGWITPPQFNYFGISNEERLLKLKESI